MTCPACEKTNDGRAIICAECGRLIGDRRPELVSKQRRPYFIALLFVPIIAIAAFIGYYKFFLPDGIAAVVNGEEIRQSELDAAVERVQKMHKGPSAYIRYEVLNGLISERLELQEARKAGITITKEELSAAEASELTASGLDEAAFQQAMRSLYDNGYEQALERGLIINRLMSEKVVPPGADPKTAGRVTDQWRQDLFQNADVRIALSEQLGGPGCCDPAIGPSQKGGAMRGQNCGMTRGSPGHDCSSQAGK